MQHNLLGVLAECCHQKGEGSLGSTQRFVRAVAQHFLHFAVLGVRLIYPFPFQNH